MHVNYTLNIVKVAKSTSDIIPSDLLTEHIIILSVVMELFVDSKIQF